MHLYRTMIACITCRNTKQASCDTRTALYSSTPIFTSLSCQTPPPRLLQVCRQHEKPLVLQLCRLVRGFTHPASYFAGESDACKSSRGGGGVTTGEDLALFSVDEFSSEMVSCLLWGML